jgi:hypothetical protein
MSLADPDPREGAEEWGVCLHWSLTLHGEGSGLVVHDLGNLSLLSYRSGCVLERQYFDDGEQVHTVGQFQEARQELEGEASRQAGQEGRSV